MRATMRQHEIFKGECRQETRREPHSPTISDSDRIRAGFVNEKSASRQGFSRARRLAYPTRTSGRTSANVVRLFHHGDRGGVCAASPLLFLADELGPPR